MFPTITVDPRSALSTEPLGTKRKFWYRDGDRRMLFKAEERGTGEDWAERIACELCELLGLPHVPYELAVESESQTPGVVCETCAPPPTVLHLGNQVLFAIDPAYPRRQRERYKVREHTVDAVAEALRLLEPPPANWTTGMPQGITSALDVFAGYVMLDAWIANQDRHHENWGVLHDGDTLCLAPTFDHGASMARNLSDEERHDRLTTRDQRRGIAWFARRAKSAFFPDVGGTRPLTTFEAWRVFEARSAKAGSIWLAKLDTINDDIVRGLVDRIPPHRMSQICREFTTALLSENRRRLLEDADE